MQRLDDEAATATAAEFDGAGAALAVLLGEGLQRDRGGVARQPLRQQRAAAQHAVAVDADLQLLAGAVPGHRVGEVAVGIGAHPQLAAGPRAIQREVARGIGERAQQRHVAPIVAGEGRAAVLERQLHLPEALQCPRIEAAQIDVLQPTISALGPLGGAALSLHDHVGATHRLALVVDDGARAERLQFAEHERAEVAAFAPRRHAEWRAATEPSARVAGADDAEQFEHQVLGLAGAAHHVEAAVVDRGDGDAAGGLRAAPEHAADPRGGERFAAVDQDPAAENAVRRCQRQPRRQRSCRRAIGMRGHVDRVTDEGLAFAVEPRPGPQLHAGRDPIETHGRGAGRLLHAAHERAPRHRKPRFLARPGHRRERHHGRCQQRRVAVVGEQHLDRSPPWRDQGDGLLLCGATDELGEDRRWRDQLQRRGEALVRRRAAAAADELEVSHQRLAVGVGRAAPDDASFARADLVLQDLDRRRGQRPAVVVGDRDQDLLVGLQCQRDDAVAGRNERERELGGRARDGEPHLLRQRQLRDAVGVGDDAGAAELGPLEPAPRQRSAEAFAGRGRGREQHLDVGGRDGRVAADDADPRCLAGVGFRDGFPDLGGQLVRRHRIAIVGPAERTVGRRRIRCRRRALDAFVRLGDRPGRRRIGVAAEQQDRAGGGDDQDGRDREQAGHAHRHVLRGTATVVGGSERTMHASSGIRSGRVNCR